MAHRRLDCAGGLLSTIVAIGPPDAKPSTAYTKSALITPARRGFNRVMKISN